MRREFSAKTKAAAFLRADGHCENRKCGARLTVGKFQYDHNDPDGLMGEPTLENCVVLCLQCHKDKTATLDIPRIARAKRRERKHLGIRPKSTFRGWRKMNGDIVWNDAPAPTERES